MPRNKSNREIEVKLRVSDPAALRLLLKRLRARQAIPRTYESNTLYDTPSRALTRQGKLIRVRAETPSSGHRRNHPIRLGQAVLTYKGPSGLLRLPRGEPQGTSRYKIREELEVTVSDAEQMSAILQALGLRPVFRYEKYRTTYVLPGVPGAKIEFDETPIGMFLELEGNAKAIDHAAARLGYSQPDFVTLSYGALYIADCRRRGRKPSNMLFQPTKKSR